LPRKPRPTSFNKAPLGRNPVERDPFRAGGAGSAQATFGDSSQMPSARRRNALTTDEAPSHQSMAKQAISAQAASLRMGKGAVRSEPVSSERMSEHKEEHRARSANLMAEMQVFHQIKGRGQQRQRFDELEAKNQTDGYLSHSEKLEKSAIGSKLRSREEISKLMEKDEAGKEIGFHPLASRFYFRTRTAADMGLTTAIHTTTNENSVRFITAGGGKGIDPNASAKSGRAADGMYGNTTIAGSMAEIGHHLMVAYDQITHKISPKAKVRDYTNPVDRTLVSNRSAEDTELHERANRGDFLKMDTVGAKAQMAALPSMRETSTINTAKYTPGMDGYEGQSVTRTYTDEERTQQEVHNGLRTSTRLDVHQHRAKMLTRGTTLFGDIKKSALIHNKGLRSVTERLVRHPTEGRVTERGNNSAPHSSLPHSGRPN